MSSLRLALKQSLQEVGGGSSKPSRRGEGGSKLRRKKYRRRHDHSDDEDESSEEENEFSAGEEEEEEDDEDESETHHDDDESHSRRHKEEETSAPPSGANSRVNSEDDEDDDEEDTEVQRMRQHRKLQKKLKHSAANKIQSQWKMKKVNKSDDRGGSSATDAAQTEEASGEAKLKAKSATEEATSDYSKEQERRKKEKSHKGDRGNSNKGKTAKTVPPPDPDVLEWNRNLPVKRARRNITQGLRVKVRFATKVKREGKIIRKKKWFGGRVHAVSKEGSKIRIKYDDSTSEISKFPDKDVVIDDFHNGEHQANAAKFIPPEPKPSMDEDDEEDFTQQPKPKPAPVERKPSPVEKEENPADDVKKELKAAEEPKPPVGTTVEEKPPRRSPVEPSIPSHPDDDVPPPSSEDYHVRPSSPPIEGVAYVTAASSKPPSSTTQENKEPTLKYRTPTPITDSSTSQENKRPTLKSRTPTPPTQESSEKNVITDKAVTEATEAFKSAPSEEKAKEDEPAVSSEAIVEPPPKKAESTVPEQQPAERPKPTLKIRLVNPNRDRPGSAQQPKPQSSPRMKPIKKAVVDSSDEDESPTEETSRSKSAEPEQTAEKESLKKNKEIAADDTLASKKRKAEESPSEAVTVAGPPTKRIHIRCPTEKQEGKCQDAPVEYPKERPTEAKYKEPPSSGRTDDFKSKTSHQDIKPKKVVDPDTTKQISDDFKEKVTQEDTKPTKAAQPEAGTRDDDLDIDDGPVKISARNSGKRLPLFSDEEDEPPSVSEKPSNEAVTAEDKPKKVDEQRKEEEAKPHRPLAKIASSEHTPVEPAKTTEAFRGDKAVVKKSENSAFERKDSKTKETHKEVSTEAKSTNAAAKSPGPSAGLAKKLPRRPSTPHDKSELSTAAVRSGRKAAQQAHERIVSKSEGGEKEKDKDKETTTAPSKKRKKRRESDGDSDQGSNEDHNNWIQCDSCKKWRIIPNHIKISSLPEKWYCHLNVYDPKRNTCEAPEESTAPIPSRKRKRGRKRIRQRAEEAAHAAEPTLSRKDSSQSDSGKERSRARNPVPKEEVKPKEAELVKTNSTPKPARSSPSSMTPGDKNLPETGSESLAKPEKKISGGRKRLPDAPLESIPEAPIAEQQKAKRGRGRRKEYREEQNQGTGGSVASSGKQDNDLDNVEWVQCEKCEKWRKLPRHISADELPDVWYCELNNWNPASATCDAPEDKADGQQDIGVFGGASGGSKLSYRSLIFGSGRKVNRPVSERTRAAESIFAAPMDDSEASYPQVMYANSSAFAPRGSRANIIEEENSTISVFELMNHSNLWAELRGVSQSLNLVPSSTEEGSGYPSVSKYSFSALPPSMKQDMKDMIVRVLESRTLLPEEVLLACQTKPWDNAPPSWAEVRAYCTKDVVITLLCELVTEGIVQIVQAFGTEWTVKDWNPRYKLASNTKNENVAPPPQANTRCMKIAKPWKRPVA